MSELPETTARALRTAIGAENAAIWVCGLARAFAGESRVREAIDEATAAHEETRDSAAEAMRAAGAKPPVAEPAYDVGEPVSDQRGAIGLLIRAETDCQVGWRAVLEAAADAGLRRTALEALTTAATRATRWRLTTGEEPAAENFPGAP
ncbi:DUF4439 domain-containing protein [Saccharopolyspora griseoalba]|uniref:DUF4439 domain-containing protein n=1 Tax=Saccharopolyspora griseoalba TaxID=1431848 RepID=A0ABW2LDY5_9PSEU